MNPTFIVSSLIFILYIEYFVENFSFSKASYFIVFDLVSLSKVESNLLNIIFKVTKIEEDLYYEKI